VRSPSMKRTAACLCWLFAAVMSQTTPAEGKDSQLYVSLQGNGAWSGLLAEPNGDQSNGPLATLEAAR
jgi:hypothetical protein